MLFTILQDGAVHGAATFIVGVYHRLLAYDYRLLTRLHRLQNIIIKFFAHSFTVGWG